MLGYEWQILLTAGVVAVACALVGTFLVLRGMAMMSGAISHTVLLGIVLGYFIERNLSSPWLIAGATVAGLLTVTLVEWLHRVGRMHEDAAMALVFPALFAVAVILIARLNDPPGLSTDTVIFGHLDTVHIDSVVIFGERVARTLAVMTVILALGLAFIVAFFKELKLATFDPALAAAFGFSPTWLHYGLMAVVCVTAVGAFKAVGSVLVIALIVAPPATALLLTNRLSTMLVVGALIATGCAAAGFFAARAHGEISTATSMVTVAGLAFFFAFLFAPRDGWVARQLRQRRQRRAFARQMLLVHLIAHADSPRSQQPRCHPDHLHVFLHYDRAFLRQVVKAAVRDGLIAPDPDGWLRLTDLGTREANAVRTRR